MHTRELAVTRACAAAPPAWLELRLSMAAFGVIRPLESSLIVQGPFRAALDAISALAAADATAARRIAAAKLARSAAVCASSGQGRAPPRSGRNASARRAGSVPATS